MQDFFIEKKIYYHDTDAGGVVYYSNYLKYMEEARTEFFADKGIDIKTLSDRGTWFVVAKVSVNYKAPARYSDIIRITSKVEKVRAAAIEFYQEIKRDNKILVEGKTVLVCVDRDFRPQAVPDRIREVFG
jgi:tol-pal system-associated acyl-CoA thioesterase